MRFPSLRFVCFSFAIFISSFALTHAATQATTPSPQQGETAPAFTLPSQTGKPESLTQFRGKWIVLYFYPEDMTAGCTLEAHGFQRDANKFHAKNAIILGVSVDSVDSHKEFCAKEGLNISLLSDAGRTVVQQYGSLNSRTNMANRNTFLITPDGKISRVWLNVNPAHHSEEVLAAIDAAQL